MLFRRATRTGGLPVVGEESLHRSLPPRVPVGGGRGTSVGGFTRRPPLRTGPRPDGPTTRSHCPLRPPLTLGLAARLTVRSGAAGGTPSAAEWRLAVAAAAPNGPAGTHGGRRCGQRRRRRERRR